MRPQSNHCAISSTIGTEWCIVLFTWSPFCNSPLSARCVKDLPTSQPTNSFTTNKIILTNCASLVYCTFMEDRNNRTIPTHMGVGRFALSHQRGWNKIPFLYSCISVRLWPLASGLQPLASMASGLCGLWPLWPLASMASGLRPRSQ